MNQGHENSHFSEPVETSYCSFFVLLVNGMLQVWTCLELAALKELQIVDGVSTCL